MLGSCLHAFTVVYTILYIPTISDTFIQAIHLLSYSEWPTIGCCCGRVAAICITLSFSQQLVTLIMLLNIAPVIHLYEHLLKMNGRKVTKISIGVSAEWICKLKPFNWVPTATSICFSCQVSRSIWCRGELLISESTFGISKILHIFVEVNCDEVLSTQACRERCYGEYILFESSQAWQPALLPSLLPQPN